MIKLENTVNSTQIGIFPVQDENGIDLSALRRNLRLTPTERIERMRIALKFAMEVRHAGRRAGLSNRNSPVE